MFSQNLYTIEFLTKISRHFSEITKSIYVWFCKDTCKTWKETATSEHRDRKVPLYCFLKMLIKPCFELSDLILFHKSLKKTNMRMKVKQDSKNFLKYLWTVDLWATISKKDTRIFRNSFKKIKVALFQSALWGEVSFYNYFITLWRKVYLTSLSDFKKATLDDCFWNVYKEFDFTMNICKIYLSKIYLLILKQLVIEIFGGEKNVFPQNSRSKLLFCHKLKSTPTHVKV